MAPVYWTSFHATSSATCVSTIESILGFAPQCRYATAGDKRDVVIPVSMGGASVAELQRYFSNFGIFSSALWHGEGRQISVRSKVVKVFKIR